MPAALLKATSLWARAEPRLLSSWRGLKALPRTFGVVGVPEDGKHGFRRFVDLPNIAVLVLATAYIATTTIRMIAEHRIRVPYWDHWQELTADQLLTSPMGQHNEHRILLGRIFFALDAMFFRGTWFCWAGTIACLVATAVLLAAAASNGPAGRRVLVPVFAVAASLLLSAYAWENLLWSFNVSFVIVLPMALGAFVALTRPRPRFRAASICAVAAAYSMANGVLVAPLLVIVTLTKRSRRQIGLLALLTVTILASYFYGYQSPPHHAAPSTSLRHPLMVLRYLAAYLGGPLTGRIEVNRLGMAELFGYAALVLWALVCIVAVLAQRRDPTAWALPCAMTFVVLSGLLTALGRLKFPIEQAFSARYGSIVLVFWSALVAHLFRSARADFVRALLGVFACAVVVEAALEQDRYVGIAVDDVRHLRDAETALLVGALDADVIDRISPAPYLVEEGLPYLRDRHMSVFAEKWGSWIGKPITRIIHRWDDHACAGYLESARAVPAYESPAYRAEGWAFSRREGRAPERLALVNAHGVVLGFALTGRARPDVRRARPKITDPRVGFLGHIGKLHGDSAEVRAVALLENGTLGCRLARQIRVDQSEAMGLVKK